MRRAALAGVLVFLATTPLLFPGGQSDGDIPVFRSYGDLVVAGHVPYRDFAIEYPPGAVPIFALPALAPEDAYLDVFRMLASVGIVLGIVLSALVLARLGAARRLLWGGTLFTALTPALLGAFTLRRFDMWPADACLGVLLLLLARRPRLAFALLAAGVLVKTYPVVLLPLALLWVERRARVAALAVFCAVGAVVLVPFAALAHAGLINSYGEQANRHLHLDSVGSSALLALHRPVRIFYEAGWSVAGSGADALATIQTVVQAGAILAIAALFARSRRGPWELVTAAAATLAVAASFGKVLSPQYLLWVAPLVVAARSRAAVVAFTGAMLATNVLFPDRYFGLLHRHDGEVWLLVVRNALLVAASVALALSVRRSRVTA